MAPPEVEAAAAAALGRLAVDMEAGLAFFDESPSQWSWGWAFAYSTADVVAGEGLPFPTGPIAVFGTPPRAILAPSALTGEAIGEWIAALTPADLDEATLGKPH